MWRDLLLEWMVRHLWLGEAGKDPWWMVAFRHLIESAHVSSDQKQVVVTVKFPLKMSETEAKDMVDSWETAEAIEPWTGPTMSFTEIVPLEPLTLRELKQLKRL